MLFKTDVAAKVERGRTAALKRKFHGKWTGKYRDLNHRVLHMTLVIGQSILIEPCAACVISRNLEEPCALDGRGEGWLSDLVCGSDYTGTSGNLPWPRATSHCQYYVLLSVLPRLLHLLEDVEVHATFGCNDVCPAVARHDAQNISALAPHARLDERRYGGIVVGGIVVRVSGSAEHFCREALRAPLHDEHHRRPERHRDGPIDGHAAERRAARRRRRRR